MEGQLVDFFYNFLNKVIIYEGNFKLFLLDLCFINLIKVINQGLKYLFCICCFGLALVYLSIVLKGLVVFSIVWNLFFIFCVKGY